MDTQQMTLEQQHEELNEWRLKYELLNNKYEHILSELESKTKSNVNLCFQLKEQETQIMKLAETIIELKTSIKAVHSISQVAGSQRLNHSQRKAIAWVQENILTGAGKDDKPVSSYDEF